ncbi:MAG: PQQ-binding-like beta-propeller repeat protein [Rhodothermales bacterium]|nr:PQQ-binding-like beta-propeller repeat protein [Rhodothermales bacterium]
MSAQPTPAMFRGGPAASEAVETHGVDRLGGIAWTFQSSGTIRSSPVVAEGVVYFGNSGGQFFALRADTGEEIWSLDVDSPVGGAPLITENLAIFIDRDNRIHAVNREDGQSVWIVSGQQDIPLPWGHEGFDYLLASPILVGSTIVIGTGDGVVYGIDLDTGEERWKFQTGGRIRSSASVLDDVAFIGSGDGIVYGISTETGAEVWRFETMGSKLNAADWGFDRTQIHSSPTVIDTVLYIGSRDASLYAVDLESRDTLWTFVDGTAWVISSPAVDDGRLFSARSGSQKVRALDLHSGKELWSIVTGGYVFSSPRVVDSTMYIGSGTGKVHALDVSTGEERWSYQTGGSVFSTPAVWNGRLYVGSDDGYLYAFESTEGPQPRLAVYWDNGQMGRSVWGADSTHREVATFFADRGYETLDGSALEYFLRQRILDKSPSAVVFAMDAIPEAVASASQDTSLFRRYLDHGGKIVWLGLPPLLVERDSEGRATGVNRDNPSRLLSVSHTAWDSDEFGVTVTEIGREWGLKSSWVGMPGVAATEAVDVLAADEIGRAAIWVKNYGGPPGTGFVFARMDTKESYLEELRQVVEYGVLRRAILRHDGCRPSDGRC